MSWLWYGQMATKPHTRGCGQATTAAIQSCCMCLTTWHTRTSGSMRVRLNYLNPRRHPHLNSFATGTGSITGPGLVAKQISCKSSCMEMCRCMHAACVRRSLVILVHGASVMLLK